MMVCFLLWNHRKLRKDQIAAKILLHLCASLLCVLIVFVAGVERGGVSENACRIVAAFIHYFLLVAFLWMLIEAYFMYQAFVKVFRDYGDYVMWKCAAMGWGESFEHVIDIVGISNILKWLSSRVVIGLNISRHLTKQNHSSLYSSQTFSRALHRLHVLALSFDWFTGLSASSVIDQSDNFCIGFTTVSISWHSRSTVTAAGQSKTNVVLSDMVFWVILVAYKITSKLKKFSKW